uniref:Plant heme peroxidase family profile domain-containing protein n=1 Tax=Oryza glumipatula TaxID=40148 RepID=A0A0D9Y755_9ORYZ
MVRCSSIRAPVNPNPEKASPANGGLRGLDVVHEPRGGWRARRACPETVSCSPASSRSPRATRQRICPTVNDTLDAQYSDELRAVCPPPDAEETAWAHLATTIPSPFFDADELVQSFAAKGLTVDDLVALSEPAVPDGGRLPGRELRGGAEGGAAADDGVVNNSPVSPATLGNQYFKNALAGRVLFTSDAALLAGRNDTAEKVRENAGDLTAWMARFAASMVKMGGIEVITGVRGEVRRFCNATNS